MDKLTFKKKYINVLFKNLWIQINHENAELRYQWSIVNKFF